jgi:hypothetical protein
MLSVLFAEHEFVITIPFKPSRHNFVVVINCHLRFILRPFVKHDVQASIGGIKEVALSIAS